MATKIAPDIVNGMPESAVKSTIRKIIENREGPRGSEVLETWGQVKALLNGSAPEQFKIGTSESGAKSRAKLNGYFNKQSNSNGKGYFSVNGKYPVYAFDHMADKCTQDKGWSLTETDTQCAVERTSTYATYIDKDGAVKTASENEKRVSVIEDLRGALCEARRSQNLDSPGDVRSGSWTGDNWDYDDVIPFLPDAKPYRFKNDSITADKDIRYPVPLVMGTGTYQGMTSIWVEKGLSETSNTIELRVCDRGSKTARVIATFDFRTEMFSFNTSVNLSQTTNAKLLQTSGPNGGKVYQLSIRMTFDRSILQDLVVLPGGPGKSLGSLIIHGANFSTSNIIDASYIPLQVVTSPADYMAYRSPLQDSAESLTMFISGITLKGGIVNSIILASPNQVYVGTGASGGLKNFVRNSALYTKFTYVITVDSTSAVTYDGADFVETLGNFKPVYPIGVGYSPIASTNGSDSLISKFAMFESKFTNAEMVELFDTMTDRIETITMPTLTPNMCLPGEVVSINNGTYGGALSISGSLYFIDENDEMTDVTDKILGGTYVSDAYGTIQYEEWVRGPGGELVMHTAEAQCVRGVITPKGNAKVTLTRFAVEDKVYTRALIENSADLVIRGQVDAKVALAGGGASGGVWEQSAGGGSAGEITVDSVKFFPGVYRVEVGRGGPGLKYESIGSPGEASTLLNSAAEVMIVSNGGGAGGSRAISGGIILTGGAGADSSANRQPRIGTLRTGGSSFGGETVTDRAAGGGAGNGSNGVNGAPRKGGDGGDGMDLSWAGYVDPVGGGGGGFNPISTGVGKHGGTSAAASKSDDATMAGGSGGSRTQSGNGGDGFLIIVVDAERYGVGEK